MLMTLLLVGFAPIAWLFSQSTGSVAWMGALHLAFWLIATCFGVRFLAHGFSHSHARSRAGLVTWVIIFVLVAVQMTTALRPLVGTGNSFLPTSKQFFLTHWAESLRQTPDPAPR
jgi:predicted PurR-regulated permease PerM